MSKSSTILASKSQRRVSILNKIGLKFEIIPSNISEDVDLKLSPKRIAEYLSKKKAERVSKAYRNKIIIGADTVVYLDKVIFGKPKDRDEGITLGL